MAIELRARFERAAQPRRAVSRQFAHHRSRHRPDHTLFLVILFGAALFLLSACTGTQKVDDLYRAAREAETRASPFNSELYRGYIQLADRTYEKSDWVNAEHFSNKALAAASDQQVSPDAIYDRRLPPDALETLVQARKELTRSLEREARMKAPVESALAQTSFDCWIQEVEENHLPGDTSDCQDEFYSSLNRVQTTLGIRIAVPPAKLGDSFIVHFELGSIELQGQAVNTVKSAAAAMKSIGASKILISGHTDTLGSPDENLLLSQRRVEEVKRLLLSAGVKARDIAIATYGESRPRIVTGDDKPNRANRRVEISLVR